MIAIQNGKSKVLDKEIIELKKKIVRQERIIQNYQSEKSDMEDEKSDVEEIGRASCRERVLMSV